MEKMKTYEGECKFIFGAQFEASVCGLEFISKRTVSSTNYVVDVGTGEAREVTGGVERTV